MDDNTFALLVSKLLLALTESTNADELCNLLANTVLQDFDVVATYLAVLESDGRISMVGSWGYPVSRRSPDDRPSLWTPMAITDTIRTGEIQVYETWDDYLSKYPELAHRASPGKSFVCVPFSTSGKRTGGLGLTFAQPLTGVPEHKSLWPILAQAGDLFISKSWAGGVFRANSKSIPNLSSSESEARIRNSLSSRDLKVIEMTVAGLTVQQIAKALNFSESTIKQCRMAIYKKLGVSNKTDLGQAARVLGI